MMSVPALGRCGVLVSKINQKPQQNARGMATLKAISIRLKSVKNIQKITQSMKMVMADIFLLVFKNFVSSFYKNILVF